MIGHAPKRETTAVKPRPQTDDQRLDEGLDESFPASDSPTAVQPHRPLWDQHPETD